MDEAAGATCQSQQVCRQVTGMNSPISRDIPSQLEVLYCGERVSRPIKIKPAKRLTTISSSQSTEIPTPHHAKDSFSEHFGGLRESPSVVHLNQTISESKPYVFEARSFFDIKRPKRDRST